MTKDATDTVHVMTRKRLGEGMVTHAFNSSSWRQRQEDLCGFARAVTKRNPVSKNQPTNRTKNKE